MATPRWLWHPKARLILAISISPVVAYLVVRDIDWGALISQLHDSPIRYALASLLIFSMAMALRAYRWHVLFIGEKVPIHRLLLVQNAGIGLNSLSPIRIISEAVQYLLLTFRYPVKKEMVAATLGSAADIGFCDRRAAIGCRAAAAAGTQGLRPLCSGRRHPGDC